MPEPETLLEYILKEAAFQKDLAGKKLLVTARTYPGGHRSSTLSHQPFIRKDGICHLQKWPCSEERRLRWSVDHAAIEPPPFVKVVPVTSRQRICSRQSPVCKLMSRISSSRLPQWQTTVRSKVSEDKVKKKDDQMRSIEL